MDRFRALSRPVAWLIVVAGVVLVSAGSATAARLITGADVKDSSLTGRDVKGSSLGTTDVKNSSLRGRDIRNSTLNGSDVQGGSLTGDDIANRSLSPRDFDGSVRGPQGPPGRNGRDGFTSLSSHRSPTLPVPPFAACTVAFNGCGVVAFCDPGEVSVSGGFASAPAVGNVPPQDFTVLSSLPYYEAATDRFGWIVEVANYDPSGVAVFSTVDCTRLGGSATAARERQEARRRAVTAPAVGGVKRLPRR